MIFQSGFSYRYKGGKGGSSPKVSEPEPTPPPQISVMAPDVTSRTTRKRKRGFQSTFAASNVSNAFNRIMNSGKDKLG